MDSVCTDINAWGSCSYHILFAHASSTWDGLHSYHTVCAGSASTWGLKPIVFLSIRFIALLLRK